MTLADGLILFLLLVSGGLGFAHGFAREILGLAGLVLGRALGATMAPGLGGSVFGWLPGPLGLTGAFLTVFLLTMLAASLLGRPLTAVLDAASLSIPNRILGGLFGLARAVVFLMGILVAIDLMGVDAAPWLAGSRLGQQAREAARKERTGFGLLPGADPGNPNQATTGSTLYANGTEGPQTTRGTPPGSQQEGRCL